MKNAAILAALSLALSAGCGKDDKKKDEGKGANKGKAKAAKPYKTKNKAKSAIGGTANVDVKKLIDTEVAVPFGEFKKIKFGMTKEEVAKIVPGMVDVMKGHRHGGVSYSAYTGRFGAKGDKNKLPVHTMLVSFYANFKYVPWKDVREALEAKWGKPIDHADFNLKGATSHFWFNPKVGVRAMLNGFDEKRAKMGFAAKVKFQQYMPVEKWLGAPGKPFPFIKDGKEILGMSAADFEKAYGYMPKKNSASALPGVLRTDWDGDQPPAIMVYVDEDGGKVSRYTISMKYKDHPKGAAPFEAAIKAKYPGKTLAGDKWAQVAGNVWVRHNGGWKAWEIHVGTKPKGA